MVSAREIADQADAMYARVRRTRAAVDPAETSEILGILSLLAELARGLAQPSPVGVLIDSMRRVESQAQAAAPTLTVGEVLDLLASQPRDRPIIIGVDEWYRNASGLTLDEEQHAIVVETTNDFDTRQW